MDVAGEGDEGDVVSIRTVAEALLAAVMAVAVIAGVARAGGRSTARRRFIALYPFPDALGDRLARRLPDLTSAQRDRVLEGLRQWLLVCCDEGGAGRAPGLPSRAVEQAWHEFVALGEPYTAFCRKAFGGVLHALPEQEQSPPMGAELALTLDAAGRETGEEVPLLFRLDTELGLADGHRYDDVRLDHLRRAAADLRLRERRAG
jgi:hypothetical protein